jgi:flagellar motility protein MotE (MotC chaperone)
MSDKTIKQEMVTYDFTKNIVGIEINPSFIGGLQTIASKFMLDASEEDQVKIPDAMKKFELIMAYDPKGTDPMPQLQLDPFEQNLYVLFGLINYLRYEAEKQGLTIKGEVEVNEDLMKAAQDQLAQGSLDGDLLNRLKDLGNQFVDLKDALNENEEDKELS